MPIARCPACGAEGKVPDGAAGRYLRCPYCRVIIRVSATGSEFVVYQRQDRELAVNLVSPAPSSRTASEATELFSRKNLLIVSVVVSVLVILFIGAAVWDSTRQSTHQSAMPSSPQNSDPSSPQNSPRPAQEGVYPLSGTRRASYGMMGMHIPVAGDDILPQKARIAEELVETFIYKQFGGGLNVRFIEWGPHDLDGEYTSDVWGVEKADGITQTLRVNYMSSVNSEKMLKDELFLIQNGRCVSRLDNFQVGEKWKDKIIKKKQVQEPPATNSKGHD
jgi:hypothetical protein